MNEYIKFIMNRDPEAKSKLSIIPTYLGVIMLNQSFVLNCFFFKKNVQFIKTLRGNYEPIRMYIPCHN